MAHFMFFRHFRAFCLISLELRFVKVDISLLPDIITFSDHLMCYMFGYCKDKHAK